MNNTTTINWACKFLSADDDSILTLHDVYMGFLQYCEDPDDVEELEEATRDYNAKLDQDCSLFDMYLLREVSACNLVEIEC